MPHFYYVVICRNCKHPLKVKYLGERGRNLQPARGPVPSQSFPVVCTQCEQQAYYALDDVAIAEGKGPPPRDWLEPLQMSIPKR
jgi:hypothetical protein